VLGHSRRAVVPDLVQELDPHREFCWPFLQLV